MLLCLHNDHDLIQSTSNVTKLSLLCHWANYHCEVTAYKVSILIAHFPQRNKKVQLHQIEIKGNSYEMGITKNVHLHCRGVPIGTV